MQSIREMFANIREGKIDTATPHAVVAWCPTNMEIQLQYVVVFNDTQELPQQYAKEIFSKFKNVHLIVTPEHAKLDNKLFAGWVEKLHEDRIVCVYDLTSEAPLMMRGGHVDEILPMIQQFLDKYISKEV